MPICRILADILPNIPVYHHFRNHRALPGERVDIDGDELQEIGMRNAHPDDGLLAEALDWMNRLLMPTY